MSTTNKQKKSFSGAFLVGAGILLSRIFGLVRETVFAHYFGNSDAGDAFKAALKIPNFLQNLFGEGVLSASFIPVYAKLLAEENEAEASRVATALFSILLLFVSILVATGVWATPFLIDLIAPGFTGEKRDLTIHCVQIVFPGTGILVLSAWCLGVLNSHRKFFLSYTAPVAMNLVMIVTLYMFGRSSSQNNLAEIAAWGLVVGSSMQFLVQLPLTMGLIKNFRRDFFEQSFDLIRAQKKSFWFQDKNIASVLKNFTPVLLSRGVVQISAYVDNMLASLLPTGAVSALSYSQTLYLLPISLFGMSVSASELPEMSRATGSSDEIYKNLRDRLERSLKRIAFFVVPSCVAFALLGNLIIGAIFQSGQFKEDSTRLVWIVLIGSTIGLLASTRGRLLSSAFYSLKDTRTPFKFAFVRVFLTTSLGYLCSVQLVKFLDPSTNTMTITTIGSAGLTASAGFAGWIEYLLLRYSLENKIGKIQGSIKHTVLLWTSAVFAAAPSLLLEFKTHALIENHFERILESGVLIGLFGILYFVITAAFKISESREILRKIIGRRSFLL